MASFLCLSNLCPKPLVFAHQGALGPQQHEPLHWTLQFGYEAPGPGPPAKKCGFSPTHSDTLRFSAFEFVLAGNT